MVTFHTLPPELVLEISGHLPWSDFNALRTSDWKLFRLLTPLLETVELRRRYGLGLGIHEMVVARKLGEILQGGRHGTSSLAQEIVTAALHCRNINKPVRNLQKARKCRYCLPR
ncbi:hypothetical protein BJ508DRAFT_168942 [Ascobolus immersus RN42]|uniref:F-box domain-containing protein n=1 Tax=Ascobolus immersus RN42 TaxID=1160509 RepID=A0A3N4IW61_ASCIM|nr:hypothetical protein BJ508DRAFT_168942 [Ascobolus immersus RN42]